MGDAVLVIGAHREELCFGERVAEGLPKELIEIYRIPEGISGRHPREDESFLYRALHRELYLQLRQQLKGRFKLLIDLHAGQDAQGPGADLFCRDRALLDRIRTALSDDADWAWATERIRNIPLMSTKEAARSRGAGHGCAPVGESALPRSVWDSDTLLYVALELYLRKPGEGEEGDWRLARHLIARILDCRMMLIA